MTNAGYSYILDTTNLSNGTHAITVKAIGIDGTSSKIERSVEVRNIVVSSYQGFIDTPASGATISGTTEISGWYINTLGIDKVEILVDNVLKGIATRSSRAGFESLFPGYNVTDAGYSYALDTASLSNGIHTITVKATGIDGTSSKVERSVEVRNIVVSSYQGFIDTPASGATISGTTEISGWYINTLGIDKVEILVDNVLKGIATRSSRAGFESLFPGYNVTDAGYSYALDTASLSNGIHTITVKATGIDGTSSKVERSVEVSNAVVASYYQGFIDTPGSGATIGGITEISGWYINTLGINKVEILVDSVLQGTATRSSRAGFESLFPGYNVTDAGYSYALDTTNLSNGTHTVTVKAIGIDGTSNKIDRSVEVSNAIVEEKSYYQGFIDTPGSGATIGGITEIAGWYINTLGINKVEILVDSVLQGTATRSSRAGFESLFPGYNVTDAGYSYALDTTNFSNGIHIITVKATGIDGTSHRIDTSVEVGNSVASYDQAYIDTLSNVATISEVVDIPDWYYNNSVESYKGQAEMHANEDMMVISGWYLYGETITSIEIYDMDTKIGEAIRSSKDELSSRYPEYDVSQAGFTYTIDKNNLEQGLHVIKVVAKSVDGTQDEKIVANIEW